jgi:hypothetical protein
MPALSNLAYYALVILRSTATKNSGEGGDNTTPRPFAKFILNEAEGFILSTAEGLRVTSHVNPLKQLLAFIDIILVNRRYILLQLNVVFTGAI